MLFLTPNQQCQSSTEGSNKALFDAKCNGSYSANWWNNCVATYRRNDIRWTIWRSQAVVCSWQKQQTQSINSLSLLLPSVLFAFSALTLLVWRQEEQPACKNWVMRCWCGYLSERDADCLNTVQLMPCHPNTLSSLASFKSRLVLPFWYRLNQVVLEKRPLNGCSVV